ncbi:MAG: hypothetical protein GY909_16645 [Oligoflexia bacterium]|nr:hypothetical protein [Oligoflexia bacterium]
MKKLLKILVFLAISFAGSLVYLKYTSTRTSVLPLPYYFAKSYKQDIASTKAAEADILLVGDRMAKSFNRGLNQMIPRLSENLKEPLKVYDWSTDGEGIHRTLAKIKSLDTLPTLIIYLGGTQEFYEKTFNPKDVKRILHNFNVYNDDKKASLIMAFPILSRFLYAGVDYQKLGEKPVKRKEKIEAAVTQNIMEGTYKLFEYQWMDLLNHIKSKDGKMVVITPPINLEVVPRSVCENSQTQNILIEQNRISKLIKEKRYKDAFKPASELSKIAVGNSLSFYLLGKVHLGTGDFLKARQAFYKANIFDCTLWRGNIIFNKILVEEAETRGFEIIDFNLMINRNIGKNVLFSDKIYPQELFWEMLNEEVETKIRSLLKL